MNFLNVGPWEVMVIVMIAILLVGPKRMAEVVQSIGRITRQMRSLSGEFVRAMRSEIQATEDGVKNVVDEAVKGEPGAGGDLAGQLKATKAETDQTLESLIQDEFGLSSIRADLEATSRETRDLMHSVLNDIAVVTGAGTPAKPPSSQEAGALRQSTSVNAPTPKLAGTSEFDAGDSRQDEPAQPGESTQPADGPTLAELFPPSEEGSAPEPDELTTQPMTSEASEA